MKHRIWILDDEFENYDTETALLKAELPGCEIRCSGQEFLEELDAYGSQADAVICQISIKMTREVIEKLRSCKIISVYGTGYNNVDVAFAKSRGIEVGFVPGYCAQDIADYVTGALYYLTIGYGSFGSAIQGGQWGAGAVKGPHRRLAGQTLLVIGFGRIGRLVAEKAQAQGLSVLACDPWLTPEEAERLGVRRVEMDEGLGLADFVTVHCIYSKETEGLINYSTFLKMKPGACFINTSRGGVVRQNDLVRAVKNGIIAGAVLDVLETEPPRPDDPVVHTQGITVTPHISYYSVESLHELQLRAAKNAAKVLKNEGGADLVR